MPTYRTNRKKLSGNSLSMRILPTKAGLLSKTQSSSASTNLLAQSGKRR